MRKSGPLLSLLAATGLLLWRGCTSEPLSGDGAGGSGTLGKGGAIGDAGSAAYEAGAGTVAESGAAGQGQGSPCPARTPSSTVPAGFEALPLFDCRHHLYVPKTSASLPAPIAWRSCAKLGPDPYTCREMS